MATNLTPQSRGTQRPSRDRLWVSKTDLIRYLRCPYAFYLLYRGRVTFPETINKQQARLVEEGVDFHAKVEVAIPLSPIDPAEQSRVYREKSTRIRVPVLENTKLKIYGQPDAVDTAEGALIPVEIKSHKEVRPTDELELAFYWMLLEPQRTKTVPAQGRLILRRNGSNEEVQVQISTHRFEQVKTLLEEIRVARSSGVEPRICSCTVCSGVARDEVHRATRAKKDLSLIWDIGRNRARRLEEIGINSYEKLLEVDSAYAVDELRKVDCRVSLGHVERWKHHAASYSAMSPVVFGPPMPVEERFIAIDLEYESNGPIWLIGICIVVPGGCEYIQLWADTISQDQRNLGRLAKIVAAHSSLPLVTWNGTGADLPQLRKCMRRPRLKRGLQMIEERHFDLLQYVIMAVRFPIPKLGLKNVADYFAFSRITRISDGFEALRLFQEYRGLRDKEMRSAIKTSLLEYNREDLAALVGVAQQVSALTVNVNR